MRTTRKSGAWVGGLLGVSEVGGEDGVVAGDDEVAGGAGEAGEVAPVFGRGDEDAVKLLLVEGGTEGVEACAHALSPFVMTSGCEELEGVEVAAPAHACDLGDGDGGDDGAGAPGLPGVDVGEVDLHDGKAGVREGVAEGEAVGGEGAGVDDDAGGACAALLEAVYERALMVGLEAVDLTGRGLRRAVGGGPRSGGG